MSRTGPKRPSGPTNSSHIPSRGGIHKSHNKPPRVDRDGDLVMATAPVARGGGHGGRHPKRGQGKPHNMTGVTHNARAQIDTNAIAQTIAKSLNPIGLFNGPRNGSKPKRRGGPNHDAREGLDEISVIGLQNSLAAKNEGGGSSELLGWLEQKAAKGAPQGEVVKIKKSRLEGAALIISVRPQDTPKFTRLHDYTFAKAKLSVQLLPKAGSVERPLPESDAGSETESTAKMLKDFLSRRYNIDERSLDLRALTKDKELTNVGMFNTSERESKFFRALMKVVDNHFTDAKSKEEAIVGVSLADNALSSISSVSCLAQTFPALRTLDLSNNHIKNLAALEGWRWKFGKLNHLILSGNPIEAEVPSYQNDVLRWYPLLTHVNNNRVRSDEEVQAAIQGKLPLPILPASFRDENTVSERFVSGFFQFYDSDRDYLINNLYDANSTFSLSVNTQAPRPIDLAGQPTPGWDSYIKRSRNLMKINHLPAKVNRLYTGKDNIRDAFMTLPPTVHPNLMEERQKWCIECHTIPGLADFTARSESGVGGMLITLHGEFTEVDGYSRQGTVKRSFDRTFVLGEGGPFNFKVVSDVLVLRSYGGHQAWQPEVGPLEGITQPQISYQIPVGAPEGFAMPGFGKSDEVVMKERLTLELSLTTGLTLEYSYLCLEHAQWGPQRALDTFLGAKSSLKPECFIRAG